ncbi:ABC transporter ATP-binding protein [Desmospora profundinema]|uniref:Molybdenum ABC transporter ATP-binding protein n=1 Tax=Desmospora profundinema TaxID=1571184 RepID=A0ABU1IPA0_9BACL|nr:ABC transporter ATP-binding protein [Desmospora profundinema]MDR6225984.1 molybdenum ABC transporter ATP-binding protein [Desmospora profundinema]
MYVDVKKRYADFRLQVRTNFHEGITVLAGASGSGKSTLLKMVAGFIKPDEGQVQLARRFLYHKTRGINIAPEGRGIGYVPQNYLLFPHLSVFENMAFGLRARGRMTQKEIKRRVMEVAELCKMSHLLDRHPTDLSGGEQQRVALSRAIVIEPTVLLLDEPFSALDVQTRRLIRTEVKSILETASIPSILVTHDPMDALTFGNEIYVMEDGKLVQKGPFQELKSRPRSRFVAEFTGLNSYHGFAKKKGPNLLSVQLEKGGSLIAVGENEGQVLVTIDPTDVVISSKKYPNSAQNCFPVTVLDITEDGSGRSRLVMKGDLELTAKISVQALQHLKIKPGNPVYAQIKATAIRVEPVR